MEAEELEFNVETVYFLSEALNIKACKPVFDTGYTRPGSFVAMAHVVSGGIRGCPGVRRDSQDNKGQTSSTA